MYLDSGVLAPGGSTAQWLYFTFHVRGKFQKPTNGLYKTLDFKYFWKEEIKKKKKKPLTSNPEKNKDTENIQDVFTVVAAK